MIDSNYNLFAPFTGEFYPILIRMLFHNKRSYAAYLKEGLEKRMNATFDDIEAMFLHIHKEMNMTIN